MPRIGVVGVPDGWSSQRLTQACQRRTGFSCLIDMQEVVLDLETKRAFWRDVDLGGLDAVVVRKIGAKYSPDLLDRLSMLRFLKERGLPVFSDPACIRNVLDRLSCTVTLRAADIQMPPTTITEDVDRAMDAVRRYERAVLKPLYTSKARGMRVVEPGGDLRDRILAYRQAGNEAIYVQKMLDLPGRDLGVSFIGGEFVGCYARAKSGQSWNTTTRSGGKYQPHDPDQEIIDLARKAQALFNLDFTSVDVAETPDGPVVFEVSAFGGYRGLLEAKEIDMAELCVEYVLGRLDHDR
jgi:ribosomal protein S6--L-glutamate ligase